MKKTEAKTTGKKGAPCKRLPKAPKEGHLVSTKDNEPQVNDFWSFFGMNFHPYRLSGPWPHPLRVHGVVSLASSPVLEKLSQILTPGLNFSVFQREIGVGLSAVQPKVKMGGSKLREYQGSNFLRQRLVLATITSTPVRISNIRLDSNLWMTRVLTEAFQA